MQISWLPEPERHPLWTDIVRLLEPSAAFGKIDAYEPCDWVWIIYDGSMLHGAATTRLWPGDEAELRLAGGHRYQEWIGLLDETVSEWARLGGADRLTMRGRRGWGRFAERYGWAALGTDSDNLIIYTKDLK